MKNEFIVLGLMGHDIVSSMQDTCLDFVRTRVEKALECSTTEATSVVEMTASVKVIRICVSTSDQVEDLVLGENGVLSNARVRQLVLYFGTSLLATTKKIGAALAEKGLIYLDYPLGRKLAQALGGRLNIMVRGVNDAFEAVKPS